MPLQRVLSIVTILAFATAGRSEEPRVAPDPSPGSGSISEAKKTFEDLRAVKNEPREGAAKGLPLLSAPELTITAGDAKPIRGVQNLPSKKSKNWLVDGVLGSPTGRTDGLTPNQGESLVEDHGAVDATTTASALGHLERPTGQAAAVEASRLSGSAADVDRRSPASNGQPPAINPLNQFMQSWISPQDRQLLLPSEVHGGAATNPAVAIEATSSLVPIGPSFSGSDPIRPVDSKNQIRDNPYIGGQPFVPGPELGQITIPAVSAPPETVLRPSNNPSSMTRDAPPPMANKPAPHEFGKQNDNGKYFRQLNRF